MPENEEKIRAVREKLLQWFEINGRDFPWRRTRDPYRILIAEIMLQRTRAEQVVPVYEEFIRHFPNPESLARAGMEAVRAFFSKLGLLWRADLVVRLAGELVKRFGGSPPPEREKLLSLPAVGDYMADAVLSFAYGMDVAVVDSNVCRVLRRIFGLKPKGEARRDRRFRELAMKLVPHGKSREFNWAMIDFASEVCTPRKPKCRECLLKSICVYAGGEGNV
ncbi:MAG: hypothetical protein QW334_01500 [Thermofilum sp.]